MPPPNFLGILKEPLKNNIIQSVFSRVYQIDRKYLIKWFHVLRRVDLKNALKNQPDNRAKVLGEGGDKTRFSQKPKFDLFFLAFPYVLFG